MSNYDTHESTESLVTFLRQKKRQSENPLQQFTIGRKPVLLHGTENPPSAQFIRTRNFVNIDDAAEFHTSLLLAQFQSVFVQLWRLPEDQAGYRVVWGSNPEHSSETETQPKLRCAYCTGIFLPDETPKKIENGKVVHKWCLPNRTALTAEITHTVQPDIVQVISVRGTEHRRKLGSPLHSVLHMRIFGGADKARCFFDSLGASWARLLKINGTHRVEWRM